jgi:hypothetical protein
MMPKSPASPSSDRPRRDQGCSAYLITALSSQPTRNRRASYWTRSVMGGCLKFGYRTGQCGSAAGLRGRQAGRERTRGGGDAGHAIVFTALVQRSYWLACPWHALPPRMDTVWPHASCSRTCKNRDRRPAARSIELNGSTVRPQAWLLPAVQAPLRARVCRPARWSTRVAVLRFSPLPPLAQPVSC